MLAEKLEIIGDCVKDVGPNFGGVESRFKQEVVEGLDQLPMSEDILVSIPFSSDVLFQFSFLFKLCTESQPTTASQMRSGGPCKRIG